MTRFAGICRHTHFTQKHCDAKIFLIGGTVGDPIALASAVPKISRPSICEFPKISQIENRAFRKFCTYHHILPEYTYLDHQNISLLSFQKIYFTQTFPHIEKKKRPSLAFLGNILEIRKNKSDAINTKGGIPHRNKH